MPNHIHLLIRPYEKLAVLMQTIKGASAKMINEIRSSSGRFWASDYYDKAIRDEKHFSVVYSYIKNNPLKLNGSEESVSRFYGIYED
jgi:REP-associated tyrosine transposase